MKTIANIIIINSQNVQSELVSRSQTTFFFYIGVGEKSLVTLHWNFLATESPDSGDC